MLTFQDALIKLNEYWTSRGALMVQPFNTEVGAGTANPATTLRVLGPEPWKVGYVEPSVRPDDSRYGHNPNRLQTHTQYQVILKPDPGDPQEQYLASLEALGIDLRAHDIRFVEDNWASPALGAWGLGWEVWLDGMEITQFTYFQQAAGQTLDPVSVEITYGIERIVMALQGVNHFKDIQYAPGVTYGEAFGQAEYEMSRYYLDDADIETNRTLYDLHASEAQKMLDAGLPMPAYYNVLKCSHTFNVLDARGVISTAERARAFATMRKLTSDVAGLWLARREELGFPLGTVAAPEPPQPAPLPEVHEPRTLLFEIGVEELPAWEVGRAQDWLATTLAQRLDATRLSRGNVTTYAAPRRLVALVEEVAPREEDAAETVRGPRASAAFDDAGNPTKAAAGFAAKHGVDPQKLERIDVGGVEHVAVVRDVVGRSAPAVLSELLSSVVRDLRAERNMRWADPQLSYVRPVRWLLALLGDAAVPVVASQLVSGRTTRVQRLADQPVVEVPSADGYVDFLRSHEIVVDAAERRAGIVAAARELAASVGGSVDEEADAGVIAEIVNLVEAPTPVLGEYEARYLELPQEILTGVMRKHQRYLPVRGDGGALLPHFVTFANGSCDAPTVKAGNEAVVRARFEDASFFWNADREVSLDQMKAGLEKLAFEKTLGSMADRAQRIAAVSARLAEKVSLTGDDAAALTRAAELAKFDLASQMVVEMTSLAGVMAGHYARSAGESDAVASALEGMERPRSSDDGVAPTLPGAVLAVADRADLLAGLFAVGAEPTGSSDPFALRRAALGLVHTLRAHRELSAVSVGDALGFAAEALRTQGVEVSDDALHRAALFVARRLEQAMLDAGAHVDLVTAVLPLAGEPRRAHETLAQLQQMQADPGFGAFAEAVQRIRRLIKDAPAGSAEGVSGGPEGELAAAYSGYVAELGDRRDLRAAVDASTSLVPAVHRFLDDVLVMDEDPSVRAVRVGLLAAVRDACSRTPLDWEALTRSRARVTV